MVQQLNGTRDNGAVTGALAARAQKESRTPQACGFQGHRLRCTITALPAASRYLCTAHAGPTKATDPAQKWYSFRRCNRHRRTRAPTGRRAAASMDRRRVQTGGRFEFSSIEPASRSCPPPLTVALPRHTTPPTAKAQAIRQRPAWAAGEQPMCIEHIVECRAIPEIHHRR
jgi:hypothetical protein